MRRGKLIGIRLAFEGVRGKRMRVSFAVRTDLGKMYRQEKKGGKKKEKREKRMSKKAAA